MTTEIVQVGGRLFARHIPPMDPISDLDAGCSCQTCGTVGEIPQTDWTYHDPTTEELVVQAQRERGRSTEHSRLRKIQKAKNRAARQRRKMQDRLEMLRRQRGWGRDAMRCGLPSPYPQVDIMIERLEAKLKEAP